MSNALSWQAIEAIAERLRSVLVTEGYRTNLGLNVFTDGAQRLRESALNTYVVALSLNSQDRGKGRFVTMQLGIEAHIDATRVGAERIAHNALEDIARVLGKQTPLALPNYVHSLSLEERSFTRPEGGGLIVAQVTARVDLVELPTPA